MSRSKLLLLVSGGVLVIAVAAAAVFRGFSTPAAEVKTAVAERRVYEDKVLATGKVEPLDPVDVVAPYAARLISLKVQDGDRVAAGQSLGEMDTGDSEKGIREAETALKVAETELAQAYREAGPQGLAEAKSNLKASQTAAEAADKKLERYQYLLQQGAVSQAEYDEVATAAARAKAEVEAAAARLETLRNGNTDRIQVQQARVEQARVALENARSTAAKGHLVAPLNGVVLQTAAREGAFLQPGALILTVGNPAAVQVVAEVSEQDIGGIAPGQMVEINWAGAPGKTFKGKVSRVAPAVVKSGSRESENIIKVYIELNGGQQDLKPGATVDTVIYRVRPRQAVQVPNEALFSYQGGKVVFLVERGRARQHRVTVGYSNELYTEIRQGVRAGQRVVLKPKGIRDGQPVREAGGGKK